MNNQASTVSTTWQVAPHGVIAWAIIAIAIAIFVHMLGFRVVGAVKVGR